LADFVDVGVLLEHFHNWCQQVQEAILEVNILSENLKDRESFACFGLFDVFLLRFGEHFLLVEITKHFSRQQVACRLDQLACDLACLEAEAHCVVCFSARGRVLGQMIKDVVERVEEHVQLVAPIKILLHLFDDEGEELGRHFAYNFEECFSGLLAGLEIFGS